MRDYFASKKSKLFLPITSVYRDKSNSSIAQKPTHDCSVDLSNSPQEGVVKHPQDSDTQLQSLTRRESDTTTEVPSKHKGHHDYETLPDFMYVVYIITHYFVINPICIIVYMCIMNHGSGS